MQHQDWEVTTFKKPVKKLPKTNKSKMYTLISDPTLYKLIGQARVQNGFTQVKLAQSLGISQQVLTRWEQGKEIIPNDKIAKLEQILNVTLPRNKKKIIDDNLSEL